MCLEDGRGSNANDDLTDKENRGRESLRTLRLGRRCGDKGAFYIMYEYVRCLGYMLIPFKT